MHFGNRDTVLGNNKIDSRGLTRVKWVLTWVRLDCGDSFDGGCEGKYEPFDGAAHACVVIGDFVDSGHSAISTGVDIYEFATDSAYLFGWENYGCFLFFIFAKHKIRAVGATGIYCYEL